VIKYDVYNISPNYVKLSEYRNDLNEDYIKKYNFLLEKIFSNIENVFFKNNLEYLNPQNTLNLDYLSILNLNECKIFKNNFDNLISDVNFSLNGKFIVINTKIVNSSINFNSRKENKYNCIKHFLNFKDEFYSLLNNTGLKVIIIGERKISDCYEYNLHTNEWGNYVMYDDHLNFLKNYQDETYTDSRESYNYELFLKTCFYLKNSLCNIHIGNGGGIHLYSQFDNMVQFGEFDRLLELIPKENIETNPIGNCLNKKDFFTTIKNKIYSTS
jgi:hypothetical protein